MRLKVCTRIAKWVITSSNYCEQCVAEDLTPRANKTNLSNQREKRQRHITPKVNENSRNQRDPLVE